MKGALSLKKNEFFFKGVEFFFGSVALSAQLMSVSISIIIGSFSDSDSEPQCLGP